MKIYSEKILIAGFQDKFDNSIIDEFKRQHKDVLVISSSSGADIDFWDFYRMDISNPHYKLNNSLRNCIFHCLKSYQVFSNVCSRGAYFIPKTDSDIYNYFIILIKYCHRLLLDNKIKIIIFSNIPHEAHLFTLELVGNFLGIKIILCYQSHMPDKFFILEGVSDLGRIDSRPIDYKRVPEEYKLPKTWSYMRNLKKDFSYSFYDMIGDVIKNPVRFIPSVVRYRSAKIYRGNLRRLTTKTIDLNAHFVYFPLQLQPELTTSIMGGEYADQLLAVEELLRIIPDGVKVYIKENPKQTELERGPNFFKRLQQLENVVLLDKSFDSRTLIIKSKFVAILNGTAGWEALNLGRPVLVFGYCWYINFSGVTKYSEKINYFDIVNNIPKKLEVMKQHSQLMGGAADGVVDDHYLQLLGDFTLSENAKKVVNSLTKFLKFKEVV